MKTGDPVFKPVRRVVDYHTELKGIAKDFADQLGAAYGARRDHGIVVEWSLLERVEEDNSEGGVW